MSAWTTASANPLSIPLEVVQTTGMADGEDCWHAVCHCTDDNIAACGLDVTNLPLIEEDEASAEPVCPLCVLAWPDGDPCPWGCTCEECRDGKWA